MSKYTNSKRNRRMYVNLGTQDSPIMGGFVGYSKPSEAQEMLIDLKHGGKMRVRVKPGQILNPKKEFERALKRGDVIFPNKNA